MLTKPTTHAIVVTSRNLVAGACNELAWQNWLLGVLARRTKPKNECDLGLYLLGLGLGTSIGHCSPLRRMSAIHAEDPTALELFTYMMKPQLGTMCVCAYVIELYTYAIDMS